MPPHAPLAPEDPILPSAGVYVELPNGTQGLWVMPVAWGRGRIETILLEPTPYQYGDIIHYRSTEQKCQLSGISCRSKFETIWFVFAASKSLEERDALVKSIIPHVERHDQSNDQVAFVATKAKVDMIRGGLLGFERRGWGHLIRPARWTWPLSRYVRIVNVICLFGLLLSVLLTSSWSPFIISDPHILWVTSSFMLPLLVVLSLFVLFDFSRAPGSKLLLVFLWIMAVPFLLI